MTAPGSLFTAPRRTRNLHPITVDLFAGGGGASEGIRLATGHDPVLAVNHNPAAIAMHAANHPGTEHRCESVFEVDPFDACLGHSVDLLWASPDCTHFSRAKGGKPREKKIRGLAWVIVKWAEAISPPIIAMENVPEFVTWGPLDEDGYPIKAREGEEFRRFVGQLEALGYAVAWKVLNAADFGAPTSRRRLFLVARRDGKPIVWPEPTHGKGRAQPHRTAAECIDWSEPMCSIFATPDEAKAWGKRHKRNTPRRPLKPATRRRIAEGLRRFVLDTPTPYLVNLTHGGRVESLTEPLRTVTGAHRGEKALLAPMLAKAHSHGWDRAGGPIVPADRPVWTVTGRPGTALVVPTMIQTGYGERAGQAPRALDLHKPIGTLVDGQKHGLVAAFLAQHNGGEHGNQAYGRDLREPMQTIAGNINKAPVVANLVKLYGTSTAASLEEPAPTVTAGGQHLGLVAAHLTSLHGRSVGQELDAPVPTVTTHLHEGLVAAHVTAYHGGPRGDARAVGLDEPIPTVDTSNRFGVVSADTIDDRAAEVAAFLSEALGRDFGDRVIVTIEGIEYVIVDISMRMLQPHELKIAQGFSPDYILTGSKDQQVARLGNSVCPPVAYALVCALLANYDGLDLEAA